MSFSKGLKIGLFILLLGVILIQASRALTLCGGLLSTTEAHTQGFESQLSAPATQVTATGTQ